MSEMEEQWVKMDDKTMLGEYKHSMDGKNRIFLPSKFRIPLGNEIVLSKSTDKCISVYPMDVWEEYEKKINELPPVKAKSVRRWVYAYSIKTEVDSQGRIALPQNLREYAEIEKNIVTIGVGNYAEIWSEQAYCEMSEKLNATSVESDLIELGL